MWCAAASPPVAKSGGVDALEVAGECGYPWLVVGDPLGDAIAQRPAYDVGIAGECVDGASLPPPAPVLERLG